MKKNTKWIQEATLLCGEVSQEDGIDPRFWNREAPLKNNSRKSDQLCCEAKRVLSLVLGGEIKDPRLKNLNVMDVSFEEKSKQLCVWIMRSDVVIETNEYELMYGLYQAQGYLRSVIAQSIKRKRVPNLRFRYLNNTEAGSENAN